MRGLDLSRAYYETYGKPMLERSFPHLLPLVAVGCVGSGSECLGFDDQLSRDHDFEPGFCLFLPDENTVSRRDAFLLERAYAKLPDTFMGVGRQSLSPVGGNRHGVIRTADFYMDKTGTPDGRLSTDAWLHIPDYALAEAVGGEVFFDGYGEFSAIRQRLTDMPEDVRLKRIAGNLLVMAQSGCYNFDRCIGHGEPGAAGLSLCEFVTAAMKVIALSRRRYLPYYKWSFRAVRALDGALEYADDLSMLVCAGHDSPEGIQNKRAAVGRVSDKLAGELISLGLVSDSCLQDRSRDLGSLAYAVNDRVSDAHIRNMSVLETV